MRTQMKTQLSNAYLAIIEAVDVIETALNNHEDRIDFLQNENEELKRKVEKDENVEMPKYEIEGDSGTLYLHEDRITFICPTSEITKGKLVEIYDAIADVL